MVLRIIQKLTLHLTYNFLPTHLTPPISYTRMHAHSHSLPHAAPVEFKVEASVSPHPRRTHTHTFQISIVHLVRFPLSSSLYVDKPPGPKVSLMIINRQTASIIYLLLKPIICHLIPRYVTAEVFPPLHLQSEVHDCRKLPPFDQRDSNPLPTQPPTPSIAPQLFYLAPPPVIPLRFFS